MKKIVCLILSLSMSLVGIAQEIEMRVHEVQRGESLERIAAKYDVTIDELQSNNLFLDKYFYVGQKLNVPIKIKPKVEPSYSRSSSYDYNRVLREEKRQRRKARVNNFFRGLASAFSMGMSSYSRSQMFSPSYSNFGGGTGNMNFLLDPNLAIMQTQQQMAQEQALNQQLMNLSIQQVQQQEQQEFQQAKQFRPNLTIEQFRQEKAQAFQMMKEAERQEKMAETSKSTIISTPSISTSSSSKPCRLCHGIRKCWTCNGERKFINPLTGKYVECPNCTDGLCSHCHGSGKD